MRFILLDTADARGCVALVCDGVVERVEPHPAADDYSSWLLPAVRRILAASQLSLGDLDGYAVCSGPGSFTGLRVGLTTVKAWAEIHTKPIVAVSRLEALASVNSDTEHQSPSLIAAYLDARRDQVFAALFERSGTSLKVLEPEAVTNLQDFVARADAHAQGRPVLWRTPDPRLLESLPAWAQCQMKADILEEVPAPFASQLAAAAHQKSARGEVTDALNLDANYVRRSDAEIFWKGNASAVKAG